MAKLKSYSCTKCAGVLNFDEEQELFGCPFCGNEFNLVELHREELTGQAESAMRRLRFDTARDKYRSMIANNPKDFEAHLGLILAEGKISSVEKLKDIDKVKDCEFWPAKRAIKAAKDALDEEDGYLDTLAEMIDLAKEYGNHVTEKSEKAEKAREAFQAIVEHDLEVDIAAEESRETFFKIAHDLYPVLFLPILMLAAFISAKHDSPFGFLLLVLSVVVFFLLFFVIRHFFYKSIKKTYSKPLERSIVSDNDKAESLSAEAKELKRKYEEKYEELKKLDPTVNGYKPPVASRVDAGPDPFADVTKNVTCAKCGGQLFLDKEKRLYECRFCGVAYGTSLLFNDPLGKAKKALQSADYTEADQRFAHMLMVDPKNFEALFGRILCAGRWKNIPDIDLEDRMLPFMEEHLTDRVDEAVQHSGEENKSFFFDLQTIVTYYIKWTHLDRTIKDAKKAMGYARENADINFSAGTDKEQKDKQYKTDMQVNMTRQEMKKLREKFDELKASLINQKAAFATDGNTKV